MLASSLDFDFQIKIDFDYANIAPFVDTYGDTSLIQGFDFILENQSQLPFEINKRQALHKGFTNAIWWVRFPLENLTSHTQNLLLEIGNQDINQLQFFVVRNNSVHRSLLTGDALPFEQRPIQHRHFLFPFELSPNEKVTCFLMSNKHSESFVMPIELWNKRAFLESDNNQSLWNGLYLGLLILYTIIPLFLFFFFRTRMMLYYFLLALSLTVYIIATQGFGFQFLWPNASSSFNKIIRPGAVIFQFLFLLLFVIEFFKKKTVYPRLLKNLVFGKNTLLVSLLIGIPLAYILLGSTYSQIVNSCLIVYQFVLFFGLLTMVIILAFMEFCRNWKFHFFGIGLISLFHFLTFSLVVLNVFGKFDSGPDFHSVMLVNVGVEFVILSIIVFLEYRKLFIQRQNLEKEHLRQELKIVNTLLRSQNDERHRIGKEINDNLQFYISQSQRSLKELQKSISPTLPFLKIKDLLAQSKEETQRISDDILPKVSKEENLLKSILNLVEEINHSNVLAIDCQFGSITHEFSEYQKVYIYRIVQECFNNVMKHAEASKVKFTFDQIGRQIEINVEDNGKGLGTNEAELIKNGFNSIKNRTLSIGGNLNFLKSQEGGLHVEVKIPL